jgi:VWFA-related protein
MVRSLLPLLLLFAMRIPAKDDPVVFKSDVALTRVDAKVVDQQGRAITGLQIDDFVLRLDGHVLPIRNFASENMPIDILLLLDVSGSMEPHIQRIASAAQQALNVLTDKDRVAIMVFDTSTRVRLQFRNDHSDVTGELNHLLRSERFNGGTHITYALLEAARYMQREARKDARRAIVILTDDQTQDEEDEATVESALGRANTVLSFLQAPYDPPNMNGGGRRRGTWGSGGGGWPGGGGIGFPGGGPVTLGRRGQGGYGGGDRSHSAGTAEIARDSGGDTMQVDEASALEDTLARLRQRYALYFYLPEASKGADPGSVKVDLSQEARLRYMDAEIHYRRVHMSGTGGGERPEPTVVTRAHQAVDTTSEPSPSQDQTTPKHRSVAVNEDSEPRVNTIDVGADGSTQGGTPQPAAKTPPPTTQAPATGGWPRATPKTPPQ